MMILNTDQTCCLETPPPHPAVFPLMDTWKQGPHNTGSITQPDAAFIEQILLEHVEKHFVNILIRTLGSCKTIMPSWRWICYFLLQGSCFPLSYTSVNLKVQCHGCPLPIELSDNFFLPHEVRIPILRMEVV